MYGKENASNKDVYECCQTSNALEFIERLNNTYEDDAQSLLTAFEENKEDLLVKIGEQEYEEKLNLINIMLKKEKKEGAFKTSKGDIDQRAELLKEFHIHDGFNVNCGLKGSKLSGGQKQRIAIARSLIRKPSILLLDEATSALDEDSQRKVQKALDNVMKNRTCVVIAHRLSTVEKTDKVFVLEYGKVAEEGNFKDLKKKGGAFSQLAQGMTSNE